MTCPICERTADQRYRPFCSRRCADVDLAKWLNGSYAIPSESDEASDKDDDAQDADEFRTH
jgi:endogenous inhibitor of DNA gyrase (YacG/DUF329 family)